MTEDRDAYEYRLGIRQGTAAIWPTRLERTCDRLAMRCFVRSEKMAGHTDPNEVCDYAAWPWPARTVDSLGNRLDDVRVWSQRQRAKRSLQTGRPLKTKDRRRRAART